ncbi:MAG: Re/Si-specific NAD(P)(+) transhydrogenase subunit alpha [Myxococcales bacterium]|nr:Re/Si-specific NAD(P)(+) transhydrogenase subunit alpha [Myxococcales bacterium]
MRVFVPRERDPGETRVALVPEGVKKLIKSGFSVVVQNGAGAAAHFVDRAYVDAGATLVADAREGFQQADIVLKVGPFSDTSGDSEVRLLKEGTITIGFMAPYAQHAMVKKLAEQNITSFSMELVPRISRAQTMDALSSQASLAGYKAVLLAAAELDKYFPLLMTAAGTIQPARVVVLGAGVAGLQALATAKRLGAVVEVSDIRPEVQEQVESLGGKFIDLPLKEVEQGTGGYAKEVTPEFLQKQQEIVAGRLEEADVVITTALVPGKPAPRLITEAMVKRMRPGAVIVDMAVLQGGNCELSVCGETVRVHDVVILGPANIAASVPADSSLMYSRNVLAVLMHIAKNAELNLDFDDEITRGAVLTHNGEVMHAPTRDAVYGKQGAQPNSSSFSAVDGEPPTDSNKPGRAVSGVATATMAVSSVASVATSEPQANATGSSANGESASERWAEEVENASTDSFEGEN